MDPNGPPKCPHCGQPMTQVVAVYRGVRLAEWSPGRNRFVLDQEFRPPELPSRVLCNECDGAGLDEADAVEWVRRYVDLPG